MQTEPVKWRDKIDTLEGQYLNLNQLKIYYQEIGEGSPLILLHGGGLTSSVWLAHRPLLAEHFRVCTLDLRGHGRTNNPLGTLSYQILADDLLGFIRELKIEKPFICGWSMGASVVLEFAMKFPDEARALVCCEGGPPLTDVEKREIIQEEEKLVNNPEIAEKMATLHSCISGEEYWLDLVRNLHGLMEIGYSEQEYSNVIVPTLILCGKDGQRPGVEAYVALARDIPQSELKIIPNTDHFYPTTNVEMFTKIIPDFFLRKK